MSNTVNNYTETDLGNISLNPRGEYDNSATYEYLDAVSYQGGSYFCLAELETTITGIAPDAGRNSEHWQMIAAPGDMTPEYTAAHNDVIKKAVQVETSRAAVELAQQVIEAAQTDVQQLHSDTVQAAQEAENSKNSAANSAQSAEQSRKAVSESEQNINGQIAGFDSRVSEAVEQSKEEINTTKQQAINTITNQQTTSVNTVKTEGEKIITRVGNDAKTVADDRATVEEATQTVLNNAQEVARNAQTVASNTEKAAASAEGAKTSADNAAKSAKSVEDASKQIEQNKKDVDSLKEDLESNFVDTTSETIRFKTYSDAWIDIDSGDAVAFYGGKNFLHAKDLDPVTINGVTLSISNGVFTVDGTATSNTRIMFEIEQFETIRSMQYNQKVFKDSGKTSGNLRIYFSETQNFGNSKLPLSFDIYKDFLHDGGGISDVNGIASASYTNANYGFFEILNGVSVNNLVIRPMVTIAERYGAGDYEFGEMPIRVVGHASYNGKRCTVQSNSDVTVIKKSINYRKMQNDVAKANTAVRAIDNLFDIKEALGRIIKIADGQKCTALKSCTIDDEQSGTITVIGKNLINWNAIKDYATASGLIYLPIALKANTTYTYSDESLSKIEGMFLQVRCGGNSDISSTLVCNIIDSNMAFRNEITFTTPDNDDKYWLRFYANNVNAMIQNVGFDKMMLVEGGTKSEEYEEYNGKDYDIAYTMPEIANSDVCYLFANGTIKCEYCVSITSKTDSMPQYWCDYMDEKLLSIRNELVSNSMHGLAFVFITDIHQKSNAGNSHYLVDYIKQNAGIDMVVFGGDLIDYETVSNDSAISQYYRFKDLYIDNHTMSTPGNHDFYHKLGHDVFYNLYLKQFEDRFDMNGTNPIKRNYYYIDNKSQNTRIIFFDSSDWSTAEFKEQFDWYVDALNSTPSGWNVIVFTHILKVGVVPADDIRAISKSFVDRTNGTHTLYNGQIIEYDFTHSSGNLVCMIAGHTHDDLSDTNIGVPIILTTTDAINTEHPNIEMTLGTTTEQAFDVFFLDFDKRIIKTIRIGAGQDRKWSY